MTGLLEYLTEQIFENAVDFCNEKKKINVKGEFIMKGLQADEDLSKAHNTAMVNKGAKPTMHKELSKKTKGKKSVGKKEEAKKADSDSEGSGMDESEDEMVDESDDE